VKARRLPSLQSMCKAPHVSDIDWVVCSKNPPPGEWDESDRQFSDKIRADVRKARARRSGETIEEIGEEMVGEIEPNLLEEVLKEAKSYRRLLSLTMERLHEAERRAQYQRRKAS